MQRRSFLESTLSATLALGSAGRLLAAEGGRSCLGCLGLQLYTLGKEIARDAPGTLKAVAAAGYRQVELYGFPDCDAMIAAARDAGLAIHSAHFNWACVVNPQDDAMTGFRKILDQAHAAGLAHLVIPFLHEGERRTPDDYRKIAANANKAAAMAKQAGIQLAYHNHSFEFAPFADGRSGYDIFIAEFSPEMMFEIDIFWVKIAGIDPAELIRRLKGRVSQLHLKDLKQGIPTPHYAGDLPADAFQEVGDGVIDIQSVLAAAEAAGVAHCHVEQDQSPDPLASIRQSADYLAKLPSKG